MTKSEWWQVSKVLRPDIGRAQFDRMWRRLEKEWLADDARPHPRDNRPHRAPDGSPGRAGAVDRVLGDPDGHV